jgi:hypothetical protein
VNWIDDLFCFWLILHFFFIIFSSIFIFSCTTSLFLHFPIFTDTYWWTIALFCPSFLLIFFFFEKVTFFAYSFYSPNPWLSNEGLLKALCVISFFGSFLFSWLFLISRQFALTIESASFCVLLNLKLFFIFMFKRWADTIWWTVLISILTILIAWFP